MTEQSFRDIEIKILDVSDYGLDIIREIYPNAHAGKNFKVRDDEKTPSARVKRNTSETGVEAYRLTDFGGSIQNENCFGLWALDKAMSYTEAVLDLANIYQAKGYQILDTEKVIYKPEYRECPVADFEGELNDKDFCYKEKEFTDFELGLLGPEIRQYIEDKGAGKTRSPLISKDVCGEVNLVSLEEYSFLAADKSKVCTFRSTEKFPILAYVNEDKEIGLWLKVYKPRGGKKFSDDGKDYRFHHLGGRPKNFIFGLDRLSKLLEDYKIAYAKKNPEVEATEIEKLKLPRVVIASGGSDGVNFLALGEAVVWFNSETEKITRYILNELKKYAEKIIVVLDADATGKKVGRELALEFMDIQVLWLDTYFKNKRNKDFKDFCKENQSLTLKQLTKKVNDMMEATMPAKFWTSDYNTKTKRYTHNFSPTFAFYFLRLNGFCRVLDEFRKDGYYFARINGNIVEEIDVTKIKNFFRDFLIEKQNTEGVREVSYSLMDALITTPKLSENTMDRLHARTLDFTDYEEDAQYFFIGNKVYKTTKFGTTEVSFSRFVLKSQLVQELIFEGTGRRIDLSKFKIDTEIVKGNEVPKRYFNIIQVGPENYDIEILENDCEFLNYLIQASRVHWQDELKAYIANGYSEEDFYEKSKFKIESKYLDEEQNKTQKDHLINKLSLYGYLCHRYKDESMPYSGCAVDEAVLEDDAAEGGAGKSVFFKSLVYLCKVQPLSGKGDYETDKFLFEGVNEHTDILFMDDVKRTFDFKFFYDSTSGDMIVNTKHEKKISLPYSKSPKFVWTTNYSLKDQSGSTKRRRWVVGFSNYYHAEGNGMSSRVPNDDFKHNLFGGWTTQWSKFLNFTFQCTQFHLGQKRMINPPSNNILLRTYLIEMGEHFKEWADSYLPTIIGVRVLKETLLEQCRNANIKFLSNLSASKFTKKMTAWCKCNGYEYRPRLNETVVLADGGKRTKEYVMVAKQDVVVDETTEDSTPY